MGATLDSRSKASGQFKRGSLSQVSARMSKEILFPKTEICEKNRMVDLILDISKYMPFLINRFT